MIEIQNIIDLLFAPFAKLAPIYGLAFATLLVTAFALVIYKYTSSQKGIKQAKEKIKAHFVEVWLYIDDPILILKAQAGIFGNGAKYLGYALVPLVIMFLPVLVLLINLEHRYHFRAFEPGDTFLLKIQLSSQVQDWMTNLKLELPENLELNAPPLRIQDQDEKEFREIDYQIKVKAKGNQPIKIQMAEKEQITISVYAHSSGNPRFNPVSAPGFASNFWHPALTTLNPQSGIEKIEINYPEGEINFLGWKTYWIWPMIILMFVFAFALKPVIKVEF